MNIENLTLPRFRDGSGAALLPPSLRALLSRDIDEPAIRPIVNSLAREGRIATASLSVAIRESYLGAPFCQLDDDCPIWNEAAEMPALIELKRLGDQRVYLYVCEPDAEGEYPILRFDDQPEVWIAHSSLPAYLRWVHHEDDDDPPLPAAVERNAAWVARERFADDPRVTELLSPDVRVDFQPKQQRANRLVAALQRLAALLARLEEPCGYGVCCMVRAFVSAGDFESALSLVRAISSIGMRAAAYESLLAKLPPESNEARRALAAMDSDTKITKSKSLEALKARIATQARHGDLELAISLLDVLKSNDAREEAQGDVIQAHLERRGVEASLARWPDLDAVHLASRVSFEVALAQAVKANDQKTALHHLALRLAALHRCREALAVCVSHPRAASQRDLCRQMVTVFAEMGAEQEAWQAYRVAAPEHDYQIQMYEEALAMLAPDFLSGLRPDTKNLQRMARTRMALRRPEVLSELATLLDAAQNDFDRRCLIGQILEIRCERGESRDGTLRAILNEVLARSERSFDRIEVYQLLAAEAALARDFEACFAAIDALVRALEQAPEENALGRTAELIGNLQLASSSPTTQRFA